MNCFYVRWAGEFKNLRFDENLRRLVDWDFILAIASHTRISGCPVLGVEYYDGSSERITNNEYSNRDSLNALLNTVRDKSRRLILTNKTIKDHASYRIAVHLHVFHPERVAECLEYLENIRSEFDLYVTTSLSANHDALKLVHARHPEACILEYPNVGADIGPFLGLISTFKNYGLVLKIHTKRDHDVWGAAWRKGLIHPLLKSADTVDRILECFRTDETVMMACGADFYKLGKTNSIGESLDQLRMIAEDLDLGAHLEREWAFVAGTMFWVRPKIYLNLARHMCDIKPYSAQFSRDGAIEHGLERALGLSLWQEERCRVLTISMKGEMRSVRLGEGHSVEGVLPTMERLHGDLC